MKLTPLDIKKQEFKKILRGYDPIEVDAFLDMVANEVEALIREKNRLGDELLKVQTQLNDYRQVEKTLKDTLVTAQENITASRQSSKREADIIMREAELKAEKILEGTRSKLQKLKSDVQIIKAQKESFARRLRHLLESQIELISVLEVDDEGYAESGEGRPGKTSGSRAERAHEMQRSVRKKISIPVDFSGDRHRPREQKKSPGSPPGHDAETSEADAEESKQGENKAKLPRISDQFIT